MTRNRSAVTMEFHIARSARERYGLETAWFSLTGDVVFADFDASRRLAHRMNQVCDAMRHPERVVHPGQLHAMGLIDEILHLVAALYRAQQKRGVFAEALRWLDRRLGPAAVGDTLRRFADLFPPLAVYRGEVGIENYLRGETAGVPHRQVALEELVLLWLANANPAFAPFRELFDDGPLAKTTCYAEVVQGLVGFFATQPTFGPDAQSLVDMLRSPAVASPHSLAGQLDYIRTRWGYLLGDRLRRLQVTLDVIQEEERALALRFGGWGDDTKRAPVLQFRELEAECERFSPDRDWMPRVVLIAKSTHVWLHQLSQACGRAVTRLDEIPEAELDTLARRGITALWLIGLWQRSCASERIKRLCGNPEADASAYSLEDYRIADDLGGEAAFLELRARAGRRGIRLASDMVPNHTGLDSRWMIEHPDRFLSLDHSPYPAYTFDGPDLSSDPQVGIHLEDHYYDRSDAAVVFKRVDRRSGEARFVYHGNDGTRMPWNDTAQLDYLKPEVREAAIQAILHVARQFPIIRFDAAMTLAKKHYQRLWFPEPGAGGAIPSRAERGLSREDFDAAMPAEFWREVVDRVAAEVPDTLLLAEAFWLMEGYFVRTLGMHRVYNSAFMNMLRDEDNASYRQVIKNTLEFDPEVLKRYVNFMNNPDERTAVDQFGRDDKYFGVCTLMVTLPGLPMFGHGQVEGFAERYGMEYRRAYHDETPDPWLVERHEREIFPLLHHRRLFAEVREFLLYDFYTAEGRVNEDVFAFSNRDGAGRALVIYHNRYASTAGWIRVSAAYAVKTGNGDEKALRQRTLGEGLGLTGREGVYCRFRDHLSGLESLRSARDLCERGLFVQLDAYRRHVFLDFREVESDAEHPWAELAAELDGRGVPDLDAALDELRLRPLLAAFGEALSPALVRRLAALRRVDGSGAAQSATGNEAEAVLDEVEARVGRWLGTVRRVHGLAFDEEAFACEVRATLATALALPGPLPRALEGAEAHPAAAAVRGAAADAADDPREWCTLFAWLLAHVLAAATRDAAPSGRGRDARRVLRHERVIARALQEVGTEAEEAERRAALIEVLVAHARDWGEAPGRADPAGTVLQAWFADDRLRAVLGVHQHEGTWWFNQEAFELLLAWMVTAAEIALHRGPAGTPAERSGRVAAYRRLAGRLAAAAREAGYRMESMLAAAKA